MPGSYSASQVGQNMSMLPCSFSRKRDLVKVGHAFKSPKTIVDLCVRKTPDALRPKLLYIKRSHHGSKNHRASHRTLIEHFLAREITHETSRKRVAGAGWVKYRL